MTTGELATIITAVAAVLGLLAALIRHWMNIERERTEEADSKQQGEIDELFRKHEILRKDIHDDLGAVQASLSSIARDLNQLIGKVNTLMPGK